MRSKHQCSKHFEQPNKRAFWKVSFKYCNLQRLLSKAPNDLDPFRTEWLAAFVKKLLKVIASIPRTIQASGHRDTLSPIETAILKISIISNTLLIRFKAIRQIVSYG